jgi:hypothetical protein
MRGWGITLIILGVGSFILPLMGMQFALVSVFGEAQMPAAIGMIVIGGAMVYFGESNDD